MAVTGKGIEGLDIAARVMADELADRVRHEHNTTPSSPAGAETPPPSSRVGRAPSDQQPNSSRCRAST